MPVGILQDPLLFSASHVGRKSLKATMYSMRHLRNTPEVSWLLTVIRYSHWSTVVPPETAGEVEARGSQVRSRGSLVWQDTVRRKRSHRLSRHPATFRLRALNVLRMKRNFRPCIPNAVRLLQRYAPGRIRGSKAALLSVREIRESR